MHTTSLGFDDVSDLSLRNSTIIVSMFHSIITALSDQNSDHDLSNHLRPNIIYTFIAIFNFLTILKFQTRTRVDYPRAVFLLKVVKEFYPLRAA